MSHVLSSLSQNGNPKIRSGKHRLNGFLPQLNVDLIKTILLLLNGNLIKLSNVAIQPAAFCDVQEDDKDMEYPLKNIYILDTM